MDEENSLKLANHIFRLLKVNSISIPVGKTDKGDLAIKYTKDKDDYEILLDSVPQDEKQYDTRELKSILTKYLYEDEAH